jgi:hypothetical protein
LKVVDTLEKFQDGMVDEQSPLARDFVLFKRQLYQMYEVQNRSVGEHELYSFNIERENIKWLYRANLGYLEELGKINALDQVADHVALRGAVFKRKVMNPKRLRGIGAFATSYGVYSYLPYIAAYFGPTVPVVTAVAAGLYGMLSFAESHMINEIRVIEEGEHQGKLRISIALSPFASKNIIADVKDIQSVVQLHDDNLGEDDHEGNVV